MCHPQLSHLPADLWHSAHMGTCCTVNVASCQFDAVLVPAIMSHADVFVLRLQAMWVCQTTWSSASRAALPWPAIAPPSASAAAALSPWTSKSAPLKMKRTPLVRCGLVELCISLNIKVLVELCVFLNIKVRTFEDEKDPARQVRPCQTLAVKYLLLDTLLVGNVLQLIINTPPIVPFK